MTNIFERAAKQKLRFTSTKGQLSTEDLFDLSLSSLDTLAKAVNKQLREDGEESFLASSSSKACTTNNLRLEILKSVIATKEAENTARADRATKQAKIEQLEELLATKTKEQMASQSMEDIVKQLAELKNS